MGIYAVLALALALRMPGVFLAPFWSDEYFSWLTATQPSFIQFFLRCVGVDVYPPLSYFPVWLIAKFSDAPWALRMPSALAGVACVWAAYRFSRRFLSESGALLIGALIALMPLSVYLGWEAKPYNVFAFFNLLMLDEALLILDDPKRGWKKLALWVAASMWSFFLSPYFIVALLVGAAWQRGLKSPGLKVVWKGVWVGMLFALPLLPFFIKTLLLFQGSSAYNTALHLAPLFSFENFSCGFWLPPPRQLLIMLAFAASISLLALRRGATSGPWRMLIAMACLPPLMFVLVSALAKPNYNDRAMLVSGFAWVILAGLGALGQQSLARRALVAALLVAQVAALFALYGDPEARRVDYQAPWKKIEAERKAGDMVIHAYFESGLPFKYLAARQGPGSAGEVMKNLVLQENFGFPSSAAATGIRGLWRKVNARLTDRGLGVFAGLDPIFVDQEQLTSAAKNASRLWWVVASDAALRRQMKQIPNGFRGGQVVRGGFNFDQQGWMRDTYRFVAEIGDNDVRVFLYDRLAPPPAKAPKSKGKPRRV